MTKRGARTISAAVLAAVAGTPLRASAAFSISRSAGTTAGPNTYYNVAAQNLGGNSGIRLVGFDATVSILYNGSIPVDTSADIDGDGVRDANVYGADVTAGQANSSTAYTYARLDDSTPTLVSPTNYLTDPGGTGVQTQLLDPSYTNGTLISLRVMTASATGGVIDNVNPVGFLHLVVPNGRGALVSGSVVGDAGTPYKFSFFVGPPQPSFHNIIGVTSADSAFIPSKYGSLLTAPAGTATFNPGDATSAAITIGRGGPNSYIPGSAHVVAAIGATEAYVHVNGFNAASDPELYALHLMVGGVEPTFNQLNQIIRDINEQNSSGVIASTIPTSYDSLFPPPIGYNLLLTTNITFGTSTLLGFDWSMETVVAGVSVADIAAVPEPDTVAGLALGFGGLLAGFRRRYTDRNGRNGHSVVSDGCGDKMAA